MNRYPSDDELYRLIEELEKEELYAPRHLKEEIFQKVNERKKTTATSFPVYTLKMAAGIAAAVLLVFMLPIRDGSNVSEAGFLGREWSITEKWEQEREEEIDLSERINERMDQQRRQLGQAADSFFCRFTNLFGENELGGDHNEN